MYACVHDACMYACVHACMHACMDACMRACMHACMHACMRAWIYACVHGYVHARVHACMDGCIHTSKQVARVWHVTWHVTCAHADTLTGQRNTCRHRSRRRLTRSWPRKPAAVPASSRRRRRKIELSCSGAERSSHPVPFCFFALLCPVSSRRPLCVPISHRVSVSTSVAV